MQSDDSVSCSHQNISTVESSVETKVSTLATTFYVLKTRAVLFKTKIPKDIYQIKLKEWGNVYNKY